MGMTAENIADLYVFAEEQDELGVLSHTRAMQGHNGRHLCEEEIVPVVPSSRRKGETCSIPMSGPWTQHIEKMTKLRPAFKKDGSVTAGNASGINDGAAAVLMMSAEKAQELGLEPFLKIRSFASGGLDPAYMGLGPVPAVRKALKSAGMSVRRH
jgi:acetyl-CoA C-acetyltransferase